MSIKVVNLVKYFGPNLVLDQLNFEVETGQIVAFLGPNGAGKTTTLKILAGILGYNSGLIQLNAQEIYNYPQERKREIGYLGEHPALYKEMTVDSYLAFFAKIKGIKPEMISSEVFRVKKLTNLEEVGSRIISRLSKGFQQRIGLAQALINDPKILLLDEPTEGLDPIQISQVKALLRSLAKTHTILFSTHILSQASTICDQAIIIHQGKIIAQDLMQNLTKNATLEEVFLELTKE